MENNSLWRYVLTKIARRESLITPSAFLKLERVVGKLHFLWNTWVTWKGLSTFSFWLYAKTVHFQRHDSPWKMYGWLQGMVNFQPTVLSGRWDDFILSVRASLLFICDVNCSFSFCFQHQKGSIYKVSCYSSVLLFSFCTIICYSSVMSFGIARSGTCFSGSETHQLITFVESWQS